MGDEPGQQISGRLQCYMSDETSDQRGGVQSGGGLPGILLEQYTNDVCGIGSQGGIEISGVGVEDGSDIADEVRTFRQGMSQSRRTEAEERGGYPSTR